MCDLYNLQLNADPVVLSACETGIGELRRGEGIVSLARGFTYAGAKSIVTSLWSVADEKTKDIMVAFYQNLKKGLPRGEALRQAKLEYIDGLEGHTSAHPALLVIAVWILTGWNSSPAHRSEALKNPIVVYPVFYLKIIILYYPC